MMGSRSEEILWAPWRLGYILGEKEDGCLFCRKAQDKDEAASLVVARTKLSYAMLNAFPYNNGHLLLVPLRHLSEYDELSPEEITDLGELTQLCLKALRQALKPEGFNIGLNLGEVAGAGITEHLHLHIVPRWKGDTNFMPLLAATKVIPQHLDESCATIREAIAKLQGSS